MEKTAVPDPSLRISNTQPSAMLPRRALQLLLHRAPLPRSQAAAFAAAALARPSKATASSGGLALEAAVKKVQESAAAKFDETVDIAGARAHWHVNCAGVTVGCGSRVLTPCSVCQ